MLLGPYVAGLVDGWIGWRYCFYINLIPCLVTLCLYMFWLPSYSHSHHQEYRITTVTKHRKKAASLNGNNSSSSSSSSSSMHKKKNMDHHSGDYLGTLLLVTATVSLVTGIALGGNLMDWDHPVIILLLSIGGFIGAMFLLYENKWSSDPIMPGHILLREASTILIQLTTWSSFIMIMYLVPQFFMVSCVIHKSVK